MQRMLEFCLVSTGTNMALAREVVASHIGCPLRKTGAFSMYLIAGSAAFSTASTFRCFAEREGEGRDSERGGGKGKEGGRGRETEARPKAASKSGDFDGRAEDRPPPTGTKPSLSNPPRSFLAKLTPRR